MATQKVNLEQLVRDAKNDRDRTISYLTTRLLNNKKLLNSIIDEAMREVQEEQEREDARLRHSD